MVEGGVRIMKKKKKIQEAYTKLDRFLKDEKMKKSYIIKKLLDLDFEHGATCKQLRNRIRHIKDEVGDLLDKLVEDGWLIVKQEKVYYINEEKIKEIAEVLAEFYDDLEELDNIVFPTFTTECFPRLSTHDKLKIEILIKKWGHD